jgi:hypothetical protein
MVYDQNYHNCSTLGGAKMGYEGLSGAEMGEEGLRGA